MVLRPSFSSSRPNNYHSHRFISRHLTLLPLLLVLGLMVCALTIGERWNVGSAAREPHRVTSGAESLALAAPVNHSNVDSEPRLGNYPNTQVQLGGNTTITPDAAPTNTTGINVSTSTSFNGKLAADPVTGVVRVTNAHPVASVAPGFYTVTVKAFSSSGATITRMFTLTVDAGIACAGSVFTNAPDVSVGNDAISVAIGDFNNDGKQDLAVAVSNGSNQVSIRLGDGLGGFRGTTEVPVSAHYVTIGDFNNDGNQDLAWTHRQPKASTLPLCLKVVSWLSAPRATTQLKALALLQSQ
jgi:FG-GAP-like repeat